MLLLRIIETNQGLPQAGYFVAFEDRVISTPGANGTESRFILQPAEADFHPLPASFVWTDNRKHPDRC